MAFALETPVVDIDYKRGDSRAIIFALTDSATGLALDDLTELFKVTGVIPTPTDGRISFSPTDVQSDQTPGTYFYDAQVLDAASGKQTFVKGKFKISQDIAKD